MRNKHSNIDTNALLIYGPATAVADAAAAVAES